MAHFTDTAIFNKLSFVQATLIDNQMRRTADIQGDIANTVKELLEALQDTTDWIKKMVEQNNLQVGLAREIVGPNECLLAKIGAEQ